MPFFISPYSEDQDGSLGRWMFELFQQFQLLVVEAEWEKRWLGEFTLANGETYDWQSLEGFGFFQISSKDDAQGFAQVHYNTVAPFLVPVTIGSNVTTTLTTPASINLGINNNLVRVENLSGAERTFRAVAF